MRYDYTLRLIFINSDDSFIELTFFTHLIDSSNCHIVGPRITTATSRVNTFTYGCFLYGKGNLKYV